MIELPFVPGPERTELSRSLFVVTPGKSVFMSFVNPESDFSVTQFAPFHHSMTALEEGLDPELFVRLHRSAIVRRDFISGFTRNSSGRWIARLADGNEQAVGRLYADQVRAIAGR